MLIINAYKSTSLWLMLFPQTRFLIIIHILSLSYKIISSLTVSNAHRRYSELSSAASRRPKHQNSYINIQQNLWIEWNVKKWPKEGPINSLRFIKEVKLYSPPALNLLLMFPSVYRSRIHHHHGPDILPDSDLLGPAPGVHSPLPNQPRGAPKERARLLPGLLLILEPNTEI